MYRARLIYDFNALLMSHESTSDEFNLSRNVLRKKNVIIRLHLRSELAFCRSATPQHLNDCEVAHSEQSPPILPECFGPSMKGEDHP